MRAFWFYLDVSWADCVNADVNNVDLIEVVSLFTQILPPTWSIVHEISTIINFVEYITAEISNNERLRAELPQRGILAHSKSRIASSLALRTIDSKLSPSFFFPAVSASAFAILRAITSTRAELIAQSALHACLSPRKYFVNCAALLSGQAKPGWSYRRSAETERNLLYILYRPVSQ